MTRTLFTLGELTLADPEYTGPFFDLDKIAKEVNDKVIHMLVFLYAVLVARAVKKSPTNLGADSLSFCQGVLGNSKILNIFVIETSFCECYPFLV